MLVTIVRNQYASVSMNDKFEPHKRVVTDAPVSLPMLALQDWYRESVLGNAALAAEERALSAILATLFGYHFVQVGAMYGAAFDRACRIPHCCIVDPVLDRRAGNDDKFSRLVGAADALPFDSDSIDAVLLPHSLEFAADPYQVLREVDRVLVPEGNVIIVGFNPLSMWGLLKVFNAYRGKVPWNGCFRSNGRIRDWLRLLGFDIVHNQYCMFSLPVAIGAMIEKFEFMERIGERFGCLPGGVYIIVAKKRVAMLTPIQPHWRPGRLIVGGLPKAAPQQGRV